MGDGPIQPVTIDTMPNSNGLFIGDGLNFVTCERSFIDIVGHGLRSRSGYGYLSENGYRFDATHTPLPPPPPPATHAPLLEQNHRCKNITLPTVKMSFSFEHTQ